MAKILKHLRNVGTPYVGMKAAERSGAANTLTAPEVQTYPDRPGKARRVTTGKSLSGYDFNYPKYVDPVTGETSAHRDLYKKMMAEPMAKKMVADIILGQAVKDVERNLAEKLADTADGAEQDEVSKVPNLGAAQEPKGKI